MASDPSHIRPEIKSEVDSFLALRADLQRLEDDLRSTFAGRMAREGLTVAEYRIVLEALERRE